MWKRVVKRIWEINQRNHKSINLKYDVFGKSALTELRRETKTNKVVTVPINLSEKFSMLINKVK